MARTLGQWVWETLEQERGKVSWEAIAASADISTTNFDNWRNGAVARPRSKTILRAFAGLGLSEEDAERRLNELLLRANDPSNGGATSNGSDNLRTDREIAILASTSIEADTIRSRLESLGISNDHLSVDPHVLTLDSAVVVSLGTRSVVNWPGKAVRQHLERAGEDGFCLVSVVSPDVPDEDLPGFVHQFARLDILTDPESKKVLTKAFSKGTPPRGECDPFFGLSAVRQHQDHLFVGRDKEITEVSRRLKDHGIALVEGESGSGKSSLLMAGVLNRWRGGEIRRTNVGQQIFHAISVRPRSNPRRSLGVAVEQISRKFGRTEDAIATFAKMAVEGSFEDIRRAIRCGLEPETTNTLVVIDQLEELMHPSVTVDKRRDFAELIANLADPDDPSVSVLLAIRSDFTNQLRSEECADLFQRLEMEDRAPRYHLRRISNDGLRKAIEDPLRLAGRSTKEAGLLADMVVGDIGERPGDLALAQFALSVAWRDAPAHENDLVKAYIAGGRVEGALATTAERVFESELGGTRKQHEIRKALVRLGSVSGAGVVRRRARRDEFSNQGWGIIQKLASAEGNRLVLVSGDEAIQTAEIAHEALLTQWERLHHWLNEAPNRQRVIETLSSRINADTGKKSDATEPQTTSVLARLGLSASKRPEVLLSDSEFALFKSESDEAAYFLSETEQRVIEENTWFRDAENTRAQTRSRLLTATAAVLGALSLGLIYAFSQSSQAEREAQENYASVLTGIALDILGEGNIVDAGKIAVASIELGAPREGQNQKILDVANANLQWEALGKVPTLDIQAHDEELLVAAFSPDGSKFATASADDTIKVWDAQSGDLIWHLTDHTGGVSHVVFSRDGARLLSASFDFSVRLWDLATGDALQTFKGHDAQVRTALFSPNEDKIITASNDGSARVWSVETGVELKQFLGHSDAVRSAEMSPDETRIMTSSADGTVRVWDINTGDLIGETPSVEDVRLWMARYSPDGTLIAAASDSGFVNFFDANTLEPKFSLKGHQRSVYAIAFTDDGKNFLSASRDQTAQYWDLSLKQVKQRLEAHTDKVRGADISEATGQLLTAGSDGRAIIWPIVSPPITTDSRSLFCESVPDLSVDSLSEQYGVKIEGIC